MVERNHIVPVGIDNAAARMCLSCGAALAKRKRRYCSKACKERLVFALRWLKNFLLALHTSYATFSFSEHLLIVNILPNRSTEVFSLFYKRRNGRAPAEDLKDMCIDLSREWYHKNLQTNCRSLASLHVLEQGQRGMVSRDSIKPVTKRTASKVKKQLKFLKLTFEDIRSERKAEKVKTAFRRQALKTHPDVGGDNGKFKIISDAYQEIVAWLKNPSFSVKQGVPGKWSYDGSSYRWRTPL